MISALIDAKVLLERIDDPSLAILEVTSGHSDDGFRKGHLPNAAWANWQELLWDDLSREFRPADELSKRLGALGVGGGADLVLYGSPVQFGTYAYWALTLLGQRNVYLLDGGKEYWLDAGFPLRGGRSGPEPSSERSHEDERPSIRIRRDELLASLGNGSTRILDARTPEEYRGESKFADGRVIDSGGQRAGHIPGARNLLFRQFVHDDDTFRSEQEIRELLESVGIEKNDEVATYCRLSHRSSLEWFAMTEILGMPNARLYDGSWTEWGSIVGVPIDR
jgi:thiosulfate/3-mercaptopyruvate sulfurtransferase